MADFARLLERTSRTFALAIPLLPDPPVREVTIAYLLFRIADTFEDATHWPRTERLEALGDFIAALQHRDPAKTRDLAARWVARRPHSNEDYLELLGETAAVLAEIDAFAPERAAVVVRHAVRTAEGMAGFVRRSDEAGNLRLSDLVDLQNYCYVVAGIVGELLTDLFLLCAPQLEGARALLEGNARAFGEGLQLVNILKDAADDAMEGRIYLPPGVPRHEVIELARKDLHSASEYVQALQSHGAPRGMVAFCAFPVILAKATVDLLATQGPGAKVGRETVARMMARLHDNLDSGRPALE